MTSVKELKEIKKQIQALEKESERKVKKVFSESIKELFVKHPNLRMITWTQFTPWFNDGDVCRFGSTHDYPSVIVQEDIEEYKTEHGIEEDDIALEEMDFYDFEGGSDNSEKVFNDVQKFLKVFSNRDMENLFGDGYKVVITSDGVEVEEYDHD